MTSMRLFSCGFSRKLTIINKKIKSQLCSFSFQLNYSKSLNSKTVMRILNVAEKNDAAKNIAGLLSGGNSQRVSIKKKLAIY